MPITVFRSAPVSLLSVSASLTCLAQTKLLCYATSMGRGGLYLCRRLVDRFTLGRNQGPPHFPPGTDRGEQGVGSLFTPDAAVAEIRSNKGPKLGEFEWFL
jgi:hypothetical protein